MTLPPFPTDDATLDMLMAAIDPPDEDSEHSSVFAVLDMLSQLGGSDPNAVEEVLDGGERTPIHVLRDSAYTADDVIGALIGEVWELRGQRDDALKVLAQIPCGNCEHVHAETPCMRQLELGAVKWPCSCTWGPPEIVTSIRDIFAKEVQP